MYETVLIGRRASGQMEPVSLWLWVGSGEKRFTAEEVLGLGRLRRLHQFQFFNRRLVSIACGGKWVKKPLVKHHRFVDFST